jgi:iron transport multicopper oxidase
MHYSSKHALKPFQLPPFPNSTLFNGIGRTNVTTEGLKAPLHIQNVVKGKRYRIRLLQIACNPDYQFTIDGHTMTIIEVEGTTVKPYTVDSLHILAGQRYSFILHANQKVDNYWIRALPFPGRVSFNFEGGVHSAVLRYKGAPEVDPTTSQTPSKAPFDETQLVPLFPQRAPGKPHAGGADININLGISFNVTAENQKYLTLGGKAFSNPSVPVLLQILSGAKDASSLSPSGSVYALPKNKVIELYMPASTVDTGGPHPMHLHGHDMYVVRSGNSEKYNWNNPIRRDTISSGDAGSNLTVRFVTDNSGPWFLHCHIDWHLERFVSLNIILLPDP